MGMGLAKSYQRGNETICIYNTLEGQKKIILKSLNNDCTLNPP